MRRSVTLVLALAMSSVASADVRLPQIITDHMILQRGVKASVWGWADQGEQVTVEFAGQTKKTAPDAKGRWRIILDPLEGSSRARELTVRGKNTIAVKDVLVGEVWLASGQSNMVSGIKQVPGDERAVFTAQKSNNRVRIFKAEGRASSLLPQDTAGRWMLCSEQALHTSAVGFFFALTLEQELDVPVAYIVIANLGSRIEPFIPPREFKAIESTRKGSGTYSSTIAPITSYAIKGAIWYQGESNRGSTDYYQCIKALHAGWSRAFNIPDMPLHMVQIAPFDYSRKGIKSSLLADTVWAAQYKAALEIPSVGLVPIHDTDINIKGIHPRRKKPVGERLAALALKNQYGKKVVTSGPSFSRAIRKGERIIASFNGIDKGLATKDGKAPTCFELSGDGKTFVEATATINGNQVQVHSEKIPSPQFVRMGWFDTAIPTLQDKNGWPVSAFSSKEIIVVPKDPSP